MPASDPTGGGSNAEPLPGLLAVADEELNQQVAPLVLETAEALRTRHGDTVVAVLFYGSCLRDQVLEGRVPDFYVLVDDYGAAHERRRDALGNRLLPPTVFYPHIRTASGETMVKYAVLSLGHFLRDVSRKARHTIVWARFSQPAALVYARDDRVAERIRGGLAAAMLTMVDRVLAVMPEAGTDCIEFDSGGFWQRAFAETYSSEIRTETPETVCTVYDAARGRYDRVLGLALAELEQMGEVVTERDGERFRVRLTASTLAGRRRLRARRRALGKARYVLWLVKTALTLGDWVPYALWKVERHTGRPIELTERQRRHPLVFGWPVFFELLRDRRLH